MEVLGTITIIGIVLYFVFVKRTKALYNAIEVINSGKQDSVELPQSFEQITNTINAQFKKVINTGKTILFIHKNIEYIVRPLNSSTLISLKPSDDEINNFQSGNEVIEEKDKEKPLSFNAPFLSWENTIKLLAQDNGKAFIQLVDNTGYMLNFGEDNIISVIKEKEGYPVFSNSLFY